jgi:penicillin-binding protein 1C
VASSTAVVDRHGKLLRLALSSDDKYRLAVAIDDVAPELVEAILLKEDRWYRWHLGFNPYSLARGAYTSYVGDGPKVGGSTVTMQLARLALRLNTRSPAGKLRQVLYALGLELRYGKREILAAYLNTAPYGRNIEGVGAASLIYFDKAPSKLSLPEALALAVIPQDPSRRSGFVATLREARARLTQDWLARHPEDEGRRALLELPLALDSPERLPFEAPHFVDGALVAARLDPERATRIVTTLDLELQHLVERQLKAAVARGDARGIRNAAALLVDTRDMGVRAQVGSADYFEKAIAGQVDVTTGKRSPGSTLKALHLRAGARPGRAAPAHGAARRADLVRSVHARELRQPLPRARDRDRGAGAQPQHPRGRRRARLDRPSCTSSCSNAGVSRMRSERHYGLALVLGGGEVTSSELARLYALLANGGELRALPAPRARA